MPSLDQHQSQDFTKLLFIGDSKSRKTSALVSLVEAGYNLRILDYDNILDPLVQQIKERCPKRMSSVEFRPLRDKRKSSALGPIIDGVPKAFSEGLKMLDNWKYKEGDEEINLGKPSEWGPDAILVLDSLSRFCDAAYDYREPLTPRGKSGEADSRAIYGDAQDAVENVLAMLTSAMFKTNVIVICHGTYMDLPDGTKKIFPQGVGQKLSPKIPQYFPVYVRTRSVNGKYQIETVGDQTIDLANVNPKAVEKTYPTETGLAQIFEALRGKPSGKVEQLRRA